MEYGLDTAMLVGLFVASILYGIFVILFLAGLYILVYKRTTSKVNVPMVAVSCLMFVFTTLMISLGFARALDAFIVYRDTIGPVYYYEMINGEWKIVAEMAVVVIFSLFADGVLIHRGYLIWGRDWRVIIFNCLLWLGSAGVAIADITLTSGVSLETAFPTMALSELLNKLNTAFLALSLGQNVIMTLLIIFRIWRVGTAANSTTRRANLMPIIYAMIESGSMYATTLLAYLLLAQISPLLQDSITEVFSGMIGITFMLLIVRSAMANAERTKYVSTRSHRLRPMGSSILKQTQQSTIVDEQTRMDSAEANRPTFVLRKEDRFFNKADEVSSDYVGMDSKPEDTV